MTGPSDAYKPCPIPDGAAYPWAEDLSGWWHLRPADDPWRTHEDVQARGVCGLAFASVHCSTYRPHPGEGNVCPACAAADSGVAS